MNGRIKSWRHAAQDRAPSRRKAIAKPNRHRTSRRTRSRKPHCTLAPLHCMQIRRSFLQSVAAAVIDLQHLLKHCGHSVWSYAHEGLHCIHSFARTPHLSKEKTIARDIRQTHAHRTHSDLHQKIAVPFTCDDTPLTTFAGALVKKNVYR